MTFGKYLQQYTASITVNIYSNSTTGYKQHINLTISHPKSRSYSTGLALMIGTPVNETEFHSGIYRLVAGH